MSAALRVVTRPAVSEATRQHPLATRSGIELLVLVLAAQTHWQPLTRRQKSSMRRAHHTLLTAAARLTVDDIPADGVPIDLPALPDDTHPATSRSLERRGLAADGRLTPLGVQVVHHAIDKRPTETARTVGGVL